MLNGIDFSFGNGLTTGQIKSAGKSFVCRYLSGGNSKDIVKAELDNYLKADIAVVFVWETYGQMTGEAQGSADARASQAELNQLGAGGAFVFFAQDIPVQTSSAQQIDYMKGANSVLGLSRCGGYGDYATIKTLFDAGVIKQGWQTYGGSSGEWDDRALLRQVLNGQTLGPAQVDLDQAAYWNSTKVLTAADDFGQYPAPKSTPPPSKLTKHVVPAGNKDSLQTIAQQSPYRNVPDFMAAQEAFVTSRTLSPEHYAVLKDYQQLENDAIVAGFARPALEEGVVYYTKS